MTASRKLQVIGILAAVMAGTVAAEYFGDFSGLRGTSGLSVVVLVACIPLVGWATYWGWSRDPVATSGQTEAEQLATYRRVLAAPRAGSDLAAPAAVPIAAALVIGLIVAFCLLFDLVGDGTAILGAALCFLGMLALAVPLALWHRPRALLPAMYRAAYRAQKLDRADAPAVVPAGHE